MGLCSAGDLGRGDPQTEGRGVRRGPVGKGSHLLLKHPTTGKEVWVAVHTKKDAGRLGNRILREAGVE
jgi:hypothetical protein